MVRCKMKVTSIANTVSNYGAGKQDYCEVKLTAVAGPDNETWSKYTPSGEIRISVTNPDAYEQFKIGDFYFVDFTPAPAKQADEKSPA